MFTGIEEFVITVSAKTEPAACDRSGEMAQDGDCSDCSVLGTFIVDESGG